MEIFKGNVWKYATDITKQFENSQQYVDSGESHLLVQLQGIPLQDWDRPVLDKTQRMRRVETTEVGQSSGTKVKYFHSALEQMVYHLKKGPDQLPLFHLGWYDSCDIKTKNKSLSKIHLSFSLVGNKCFIEAATTSHGTRLQIPGESIDLVLNDKDRHELYNGTLIKAGEKNFEDAYLFLHKEHAFGYLKNELEKAAKSK